MSFPNGSYPIRDQAYYPSQPPNFGPAPGNPGYYGWGHAPYPPQYPQGTQETAWYGPPQAPNHPFASGTYHPPLPQMPHPSYGSGYYSAPQWYPNPETYHRVPSRSSHSHPTYDPNRSHTPHPHRGPSDIPQPNFYPQNSAKSSSGPARRRPSEPPEDTQTFPNFGGNPTPHANGHGHGAHTPYPGRPADLAQPSHSSFPPAEASLWNSAPQLYLYPEPQKLSRSRSSRSKSSTYDHGAHTPYPSKGPLDLPQPHIVPQNARSRAPTPVRRRPSEPPDDPRPAFPNTPHPGRPAQLPHEPFPLQGAPSWMPTAPDPVRRHPSEPADTLRSFPQPTVGPMDPHQPAPLIHPHYIVPMLISPVSRYPSVDWNITLPIESARLWTDPKTKTRIDFSQFAIVPPVRTVNIVARKSASPLGLALKLWGPIKIRAKEYLTIGDLLNEIKKFFDIKIRPSDLKRIDDYMQNKMGESNSKRYLAGGHVVWGESSVQVYSCRADALFENFQYAGLILGDDFAKNRQIALTLENGSGRYRN